jgi:glycosyltransferase involved in cell wall biosynthesis
LNSAPPAESSPSHPDVPAYGVSVIIPAYNYAQYLERAVRSVFAQRHVPLEVIVVDDGSTDDTPALCLRLQAEFPRLRCVRQENAGLSAARNAGIRNAAHSFVAFLDADDEWLPECLDTLMAEFHRQPPATPAVACNSFRVDSSGTTIGEKNTVPRGDRFFTAADILLKTRFMPSSVVARRSAFDTAGFFDTTLRSSEDRDMWIRIATGAPIRYLDADRMRRAMRQVCRKCHRAGVVPRSRLGFWLRVLAVDHFQGAWMYWDEGRASRALLHSTLSMVVWPLPLDHRDLHEPRFFRLRAAARFLLRRAIPDRSPAPLSP